MANAFVPPAPDNEVLDYLFSSQADWGTQKLTQTQTRKVPFSKNNEYPQRIPYGGEGFYDHSYQQELGHSSEYVQTVSFTPQQQYTNIVSNTPNTEDCRLDFSFHDPDVPGGRSTIGLRSITEIPEKYQSVFSEYSHFNLVQSKVYDDIMYTDIPLVTSAPTGSGKTVIFELAIVRLLMQMVHNISMIKVVYVAPVKALCNERYDDWTAKFSPLGLHCSELTGDTQLDDYFELQNAQIIMTTPEKWDSMTRKWRDNKSLVQLVQLFLIDEIHQLNDETRGPTMEAIVCRMKTVRASVSLERGTNLSKGNPLLRFIGVSATVPNVDDVAVWLGSEEQPAITHCIDESHRPVQLRRVVLAYPNAATEFKFDLSLNYKVSGVIQCYSDQKPTLVFCATRKGTQQAAVTLVKDARFVINAVHKKRLQTAAVSLNDSKLREIVIFGVGYHHAGMSTNDRKATETMFYNGELPVLFATSTLAMGVNLPAHLVIIKSTMQYASGMFKEYSETQILQMIGRAGRPQFDTSATAVIMTGVSTKAKYEALLNGTQQVESNLHSHLIEHLNAEIVLQTITDISIALDWLKSTFLYTRIKKNPSRYGIPENIATEKLEDKLQDMCLENLKQLEGNGMLIMEDGFTLTPTDAGRLMARYYVAFESMKRFLTLKGSENLGELVEELSKCKEFQEVHLRINERRILNQLNKDKHRLTIRFPMAGKIKSTDMKVNCLIQATLGCLAVQEFGLSQDSQKIFRSASRLSRCLMEVLLLGTNFTLLYNAVILHKCISAKLWENSKHVAKQLDKIGVTLSTTLVNAGLISFEKILQTNARELELIVNRHPPFGNQVKEAASKLPQYSLSIEQSPTFANDHSEVIVTVVIINHTLLKESGSTAGPSHSSHSSLLIIGDEDNVVIMKQKIMDSQLLSTGKWTKRIAIQRSTKGNELRIHLVSLNYVGIDLQQSFTPQYSGYMKTQSQSTQLTALSSIGKGKGPAISNITPLQSKGRRRQCNHRCINKSVCGHECCKYGLPDMSCVNSISKSHIPPSSISSSPSSAISSPFKLHPTKVKKAGGMSGHIDHLHQRVQVMPNTPGLHRLKVPSSDYRDYLSPNKLKDRYSYSPRDKLVHSTNLSSKDKVSVNLFNGDKEIKNSHIFGSQEDKEDNDEFDSLDIDLMSLPEDEWTQWNEPYDPSLVPDEFYDLPPTPPLLPPPLQRQTKRNMNYTPVNDHLNRPSGSLHHINTTSELPLNKKRPLPVMNKSDNSLSVPISSRRVIGPPKRQCLREIGLPLSNTSNDSTYQGNSTLTDVHVTARKVAPLQNKMLPGTSFTPDRINTSTMNESIKNGTAKGKYPLVSSCVPKLSTALSTFNQGICPSVTNTTPTTFNTFSESDNRYLNTLKNSQFQTGNASCSFFSSTAKSSQTEEEEEDLFGKIFAGIF